MAWYIRENGKEAGPCSIADLSERVTRRQLAREDLVRDERRDIWQPAGSIAELTPLFDAVRVDGPFLDAAPRDQPSAPAAPTADRRKERKRFFVIRHWRGQLSLAVSFWLVGMLAPLAVGLLNSVATFLLDRQDVDLHLYGIIMCLLLALTPINTIWVLVGIYRSAERYQDKGGSATWAGLSRLCVILWGMAVAVGLVITTWPGAKEAAFLTVGIDRIPAYRLSLLPGGKEVELSGGLSFGTARALGAILAANPGIRTLHLNSLGGRLREAVLIDRLVRQNNLDTYTATECDSACTLIFVAGKRRYLANGARLGFHSTSIVGTEHSYAVANLQARHLYAAAGLPSAFISHALATPNTDVWYPAYDQLQQAHVIDAVVDPKLYGSSGMASAGDLGALDGQLAKIPVFNKLKQYDPAEYDYVSKELKASLSKGMPPIDIEQKMMTFFEEKLLPSHVARAPDAAVFQFAHDVVDQLRYIGANSPQYCQLLLHPDGKTKIDMDALLSAQIKKSGLDTLGNLIEESALHPYTTLPDDNLRAATKGAFKAYVQLTPGAADLLRNREKDSDHPEKYCNVIADLYDTILSEDNQEESAAILRFILAREK